MEVLYLLIPLSVIAVAVAAYVFLRMSDSGQFDDMDGPAHSILLDDDRPPQPDADRKSPERDRNSPLRDGPLHPCDGGRDAESAAFDQRQYRSRR